MRGAEAKDAGREPGRGRHIVQGLGSLSVQSMGNTLLGFFLVASLLRFLPSVDYGAYSSMQVIVGVVVFFYNLGLGGAIVRHLSPDSEAGGRGWGAAKASLLLSAGLAGAVSVAFAAASPGLSQYFMKSASWAWVFYLGAVWLFVSSVSYPFQALLQGMRRYTTLAGVLFFSRLAAVAAAVAGVAVYHSLPIAIAAAAGYFALVVAATLRVTWRQLSGADPRPHFRAVLRYAVPVGTAWLAGAVASNADILVVGGFLGPVHLAVYNAMVVISTVLMFFFVTPLATALFAETSFSAEAAAKVKEGVSLAYRFVLLTLLPASLLAAAVAPQLVYLFSGGGAYVIGVPSLRLICTFFLFLALETVTLTVLQGVGDVRQVLAVGLVTSAGEVGLSVALVPGTGMLGAAVSRVAMSAVGFAMSFYLARRYAKGAAGLGFLARALAASGVPALAVYALSALVSDGLATLVPYSLLGLALYLAAAKGLRLFSAEDKGYLTHLLPASLQWVLRLV